MIQKFLMLINGQLVEAEKGDWIDSIDPASGEVWARVPNATAQDVNRAVETAHYAMTVGPWSKMTPYQRGRRLERLSVLVRNNSKRLAELETQDTGKLFRETQGSCSYVPAFFEFYGGIADKTSGRTLPIDKPDFHVYTLQEPIGVVAAIVPWNSPLMLMSVKLGPALAAGNAIVIKPSEHASIPLLEFAKLIKEADIPDGVVNIITGYGNPAGESLTCHPLVRRIAFTGGPETARSVVRNSAENFAFVTLELGGKSPQIIFDDANLESAINGVVAGIFGASGQSCVAGSRLYVQSNIYDLVVEKVIDRGKKIQIGHPLDIKSEMGPLATESQLKRFEKYLDLNETEGARVLSGGARPTGFDKGWYVEPTVIECRESGIQILEDELFAPVLAVMPFTGEADVIEKANASRFGLASGVWTQDVSRSHRMAKALECGIVWINTYRAASPVAPFGGYGDSGQSRESGADAIFDYSQTKTVWIKTSDTPMEDPFKVQ